MSRKLDSTEKIDSTTQTDINHWNLDLSKEQPEPYHYGGKANAGKILKVSNDGFIRLGTGGGGGTTYTGTNGITVDNTAYTIGLDTSGSSTPELPKLKVTGDLTLDKGADFNASTGAELNVYCEATFTNTVDFTSATVTGILPTVVNDKYLHTNSSTGALEWATVSGGASIIEKTWSELKTLRDAGNLVVGQYYRITDYVATTNQTNTQSANHPFDLVVFAIANNKLSENCYAAHHSGDTYFTNTDLSAWDVWYCLDNDTNRFAWADTTNGKGVIYYLKDEFSNSAWYDFKGILVKNSSLTTRFYYLFDRDTHADDPEDASLNTNGYVCYNNSIGAYYITDTYFTYLKFQIGRSIFNAGCYNNTIGNNFYSNTIGSQFQNNTIGNNFYSNTIGDQFQNNTIGNNFNYNTIGSQFQNNTIGNGFGSNTIGNNFNYNTIGNNFYSNTIGNYFNSNTIGDYFHANNLSTQTSQPINCSFPSGVDGLITTSTTLTRLEKTTYYIGSDDTLKTLD